MEFLVQVKKALRVLFEEHEIPWGELAFPSVEHTLRHYFEDRKKQVFPTHLETLGTRLDHTG